MRQYKIIKTDLGWNLFRRKEEKGFIFVEFLNCFGYRTWNRDSAKVFYNKDDALSALVVHKIKGERKQS